MDVRHDAHHLLLRLERGEEVVGTVTEWVAHHPLPHARLHGIGALRDVTLGYFDVDSRSYRRRELPGSWELLSLAGNLGWVDGAPVLHAHAVVGGPEMEVRGGHLFAGTVSVTCELFLVCDGTRLERVLDPETGLKFWHLHD
jgi:predicted DNA-binding protein with PD1-like motif